MNNFIIRLNDVTLQVEGFYSEEIHGKEYCNNLCRNNEVVFITKELWRILMDFNGNNIVFNKKTLYKLMKLYNVIDEQFVLDEKYIDCFTIIQQNVI